MVEVTVYVCVRVCVRVRAKWAFECGDAERNLQGFTWWLTCRYCNNFSKNEKSNFLQLQGFMFKQRKNMIKGDNGWHSIPIKIFNGWIEFRIISSFMNRPAKPLTSQASTFRDCCFMQPRKIIQFLIKFKETAVKWLCDPVLNFMGWWRQRVGGPRYRRHTWSPSPSFHFPLCYIHSLLREEALFVRCALSTSI